MDLPLPTPMVTLPGVKSLIVWGHTPAPDDIGTAAAGLQCTRCGLYSFCFYSGLPNYRSRQAPAQEVRAAVPDVGHVQVSADQGAAGAHPGVRHDHQEDAGAGRHGAAHRADDAAVLPEPQLPGLRLRQPDGRGHSRSGRSGRGVRAAHRRHVGRLFHVRAAVGRRVPAEQRVQGLLQEPDGRDESHVPSAEVKDHRRRREQQRPAGPCRRRKRTACREHVHLT